MGEDIHDVDQLNHAVSGSNLELIQLQPGRLDATVDHWLFDDLSVDHGKVNLPLRVGGGLDPQRFAVGLFHPGARATWNGHEVDPSRLLIFAPGRELSGYISESYRWTSLVIPPVWMETISAVRQESGSRQNGADCCSLRPEASKLAELWRAVASIVAPAPPLQHTGGRSLWLTTDLRNALGGAIHSVDRPQCRTTARTIAHFRLAQRAERYLRERIAEPLCIDEVCTVLRVSRRYLEYAFADAFGTSPSRYLRLLRLHEVRRSLKTLGRATTVTDAAINLGFNHLSLFSVQYKRVFGESPSTTLATVIRPATRKHRAI